MTASSHNVPNARAALDDAELNPDSVEHLGMAIWYAEREIEARQYRARLAAAGVPK